MEIDPDESDTVYRSLGDLILPRPIGWISTTSTDGVDNLAPYSFSNAVSNTPPVLMFSSVHTKHGETKDSARNALDTGEFVLNVVTESLVKRMDATARSLDTGESEFDDAGLEPTESTVVGPPRVADTPIALECEVVDEVSDHDYIAIFGEVVYMHVSDDLVHDGRIDSTRLDAVGRAGGPYYTTVESREADEVGSPDERTE